LEEKDGSWDKVKEGGVGGGGRCWGSWVRKGDRGRVDWGVLGGGRGIVGRELGAVGWEVEVGGGEADEGG